MSVNSSRTPISQLDKIIKINKYSQNLQELGNVYEYTE